MSDYISRHRPQWQELEQLVARARTSIKGLSPEELGHLDVLYRQTTVHLAQVATRTRDADLTRYLNDLVASAHSIIYLPPRKNPFIGAYQFILDGFAQSVARNWKYHLAGAALFMIGALFAYFAATSDSAAAYALLSADDVRQPGSSRDQLLQVLRSGREMGGGKKFFFASFLFSNNLKVGLLALATGALAAVPTVLLMLYNGMIIGAFTAIHHQAGIYSEFWAWILPHGITEIGAIFLCGGMGLRIGHALVCPGDYTRAESLQRAGIDAAQTCVGVAGMLFIAAIIESFLRQSHLSDIGRLIFAAGSALFWMVYFGRGFLLPAMRLESRKKHALAGINPTFSC